MASKCQRGESSRAAHIYDHDIFTSIEAANFYHNALVGKSFILESGLCSDETQDGEMTVMIVERNWFDVTAQPGMAVINVVKEFYANERDSDNKVVQVRGRSISFSRNAINAYYNLPTIWDDRHYLSHGSKSYNLDTVLRRLGKPGTQWTLKQGTIEMVSFSHTALS